MLDKLQEKSIEELVEIQKEISNLISQKQKEKKKELKKQFEKMANEAGLTIDEVVKVKSSSKAKVKYKKGNKTWSGRGRRPAWVIEIEENGEEIENYLV